MATVISIVSYPFLPAKVGGQKGIALFNKYFSLHHRLVCVTTQKNDPSAAEGYEVLNELSDSPTRYINPFYFFKLRRIIRDRQATHLILEHPYFGWLGILLKWFCGVKLVVHSHNIEGLRWKTLGKWWWRILWTYEKYTHRAASFNFFIHDDDRQYAISHFGLKPGSCLTVTYGIEWDHPPAKIEREKCAAELRRKYSIGDAEQILLFNGAFNYAPNLDALLTIIQTIDPLLSSQPDFKYRIIICGRDIPQDIAAQTYSTILIAGFVEDIGLYFNGADIFINPISEGGGIKTKLVEALGHDLNAVSTMQGATGISTDWCNGKLLISDDGDWISFATLVIQASRIKAQIPVAYFEHFYWGFTAKRAAEFIMQQQ